MSSRSIGDKAISKAANRFDAKPLSTVFESTDGLTASWEPIPTGFSELDKTLNGGLIPELYVIGAEPGTGKSTFMLNMAERIAERMIKQNSAKNPVMYFSLEMPSDYIARLIICHRLIKEVRGGAALERTLNPKLAIKNFTSNKGLEALRKNFGEKESSQFETAFEAYKQLGEFIYIFERDKENPKYNAKNIYNEVEKYKESFKSHTPIVIVDYLQILDGMEGMSTTDQRSIVDYNVGILVQITTELRVPVIAISSLSRRASEEKTHRIKLSHLKESGRIEYSADVVWGLQHMDTKSVNNGIKKRELELSILKNRYGEKDVDVPFSFYPEFGLFDNRTRKDTENPETKVAEEVVEQTTSQRNLGYILNSKISNTLKKERENCNNVKTLALNEKFCTTFVVTKKSEEKDGAKSLTLWDLAVLDAVYSVTDRGRRDAFSVPALYKFMCGKSKLSNKSDQMTGKIEEALARLQNREIIIDITEELEMRKVDVLPDALKDLRISPEEIGALPDGFNKTPDRVVIKGALLVFEKENTKCKLGKGSALFEYTSHISRQYMKYDAQLWSHTAKDKERRNFTQQRLLIRYYLIHAIKVIEYNLKQNRAFSRDVAVYRQGAEGDTLFSMLLLAENSEGEYLSDKAKTRRRLKRVSEDAKMILTDLAKQRLITGFEQVLDGGDVVFAIKMPKK